MSSIESTITALMGAVDLPERLAAVLGGGPPGRPRRKRMSPQLSYGRHAGPAPHTARPAAVMLLLFQRAGRWHLPLTERPVTLLHHGGQICLPGGAVDAGETSSEAAEREVREELGFGGEVIVLGQLADCYVFASDYVITPWLAVTKSPPSWRPQADEVQAVVEMPLEALFDAKAVGSLTIRRGAFEFLAPCLRVGEAQIWGATSTILESLADVMS